MMSANLRAFLWMIRVCEGTSGPDGYRTMFGGGLFASFRDHPRKAITKPLGSRTITSTAAGAYQFLAKTWDECAAALGLTDFGPESQDRAAAFLIKRRGALADVEAGRIEAAIAKCAKEWASLPGSPYGQPVKTLEKCLMVYRAAGGLLEGEIAPEPKPAEPAPIIDRSTYSPDALAELAGAGELERATRALPAVDHPKETAMPAPVIAAIATAALPELIKRIPEWAAIFSDRSRSSHEQYAEAAKKAAEVAMQATQTATVEDAIRTMDSSPQALAAAREAAALSANELLGILLKAGEADEKSRDAASARSLRDRKDLGPWLAERQFWLAAGFAGVTALALVVGFFLKAEKEVMLVLATLFVNLAGAAQAKWGTIQDYRWGSSLGSAVKDEIRAQGK
jgi:muramidase (phage lysozyme)